MTGLLVASGLGLTVSLIAGTLLLRTYLYDRASEQVTSLGNASGMQGEAISTEQLCSSPATPEVLPSDFRLVVVDAAGATVCRVPADEPGPPVRDLAQLETQASDGTAVEVDGDGGPWATSVVGLGGTGTPKPTGEPGGAYAVLAMSLADADQTTGRLLVGGFMICLLVLGLLAVGGRWVIRVGLRPLTEVREAARGIGRGDLSARVPHGAPGTEVSELSTALNVMLEEIEQGFEERRESERRIRQFAADASHELRTPLTSIKGYSELYSQFTERDDRDDVVRRIGREADRLTTIVADLLLLARMDQKPRLVLERVDLVEVVHDVLAGARVRHPARPLNFVVSGPVEVQGDRGRLQQVLGNLVTNALVHTQAPISVTIRHSAETVEVDVSDQGPGMPGEVVAHVFDRFYRADAGRSHAAAGSGLGLAIVKAIVNAHGGTVTCASSVERGSIFRVRLPSQEEETRHSTEQPTRARD